MQSAILSLLENVDSMKGTGWADQCRNCKKYRKDHTEDGKCLYEPTSFEGWTPEELEARKKKLDEDLRAETANMREILLGESFARKIFPVIPLPPKKKRNYK